MSNTITLQAEQFKSIINVLTHEQLKVVFLNFINNGTIEQVATNFEPLEETTELEPNVVQLVPPASETSTSEEETTSEEEVELDFSNCEYKGTNIKDKQIMREWLKKTNSMNSKVVQQMLTVSDLKDVPNYVGQKQRCDSQAIRCTILRLKGYTSVYEKNGDYTTIGQNGKPLTGANITLKGAKGEVWEGQMLNIPHAMFGEYMQAYEIWNKVVANHKA